MARGLRHHANRFRYPFKHPMNVSLISRRATRVAHRAARLTPLAAALLCLPYAVQAQTAAPASSNAAATPGTPATTASSAVTLRGIVVTGNPLGSDLNDMVTPVSTLEGDELTIRRASTLGETLNDLPGVSSSYFGPNASRPVIRGLDGDRIRILQNGGTSLDASALSYDHALPIDPLAVDRVEVVRGPAALLYGGTAIGGVVNVITNRIPKEPINGVHGAVDARAGGADAERGGSAMVEAGNGQFAVHADAFDRHTSNLHIPGFARSERLRNANPLPDGETEAKGRLPNSSARQQGGSVGGAYTWADGYLGASYTGYRSNYGTVAEEDVRIDMKQDNLALEGEARNLGWGIFDTVRSKINFSAYEHKEIENGETGTTFKNRGWDARFEAQHRPIGKMKGVIGAEFGQKKFSALGEEAFVPSTETDNAGLFILEELPLTASEDLKLSLGGRMDHTRIKAKSGDNERFTDASRSFNTGSASAGLVYKLNPAYSLTSNLAYTERAPTFYELFANGPHLATGSYEIGDPDARKEKATSLDLGMRFGQGTSTANVSAYYSRFANYLALGTTGVLRNEEGAVVGADGLPEYRYAGVPAVLYGVEAEGKTRVAQQLLTGADTLDVSLRGDVVRGKNRDTGEALPRLAPWRLGASLIYGSGPWGARADVSYVARQTHVPVADTATDSYTLLGASFSYRFKFSGLSSLAYVRLDNLTNETARTATSVLRDIAPLGGRGVKVGLRTTF